MDSFDILEYKKYRDRFDNAVVKFKSESPCLKLIRCPEKVDNRYPDEICINQYPIVAYFDMNRIEVEFIYSEIINENPNYECYNEDGVLFYYHSGTLIDAARGHVAGNIFYHNLRRYARCWPGKGDGTLGQYWIDGKQVGEVRGGMIDHDISGQSIKFMEAREAYYQKHPHLRYVSLVNGDPWSDQFSSIDL